MSILEHAPGVERALTDRATLGRAAWIVLGTLLALMSVAAAQVDIKLGIAFVGAVVITAAVFARPILILHVAVVAVFFENTTFSGTTVTRMLTPLVVLIVALEIVRVPRASPSRRRSSGRSPTSAGRWQAVSGPRARTERDSCSNRSRSRSCT